MSSKPGARMIEGWAPVVLHSGNPEVAPLIGLPSGAKYAVREHRVADEKAGYRQANQLVRVDRDRRPKKVRKAARRAERERLAALGAPAAVEAGA